ncbi:MAG TPA: efflux RND transporter periplasmic adaptor subunit [Thermoanaerobaculia bacterium]|jgi:multidrug efflux pump subunit AcrA (membrane-fusion protein)
MKATSRRALRLVLAVALAAAAPVSLVFSAGCGRKGATPAAAKKYQCPMHPEIIRDAPGNCPICGMKLVPMEEASPAATARTTSAKAASGPRKILFYRSPMGTGETSPTPRKDSMGMDFVPVYSDETEAGGGPPGPEGLTTVTVDARKESLLGLKTVAVVRGPFGTSIRTTGRVASDERRVHHVHTRYEGFVEHVTADFTGKFVKKGEALAFIYSPELYATQQEYLLALRASHSLGASGVPSVAQGGRDLLSAARERLLLWEITPADIERIEKNGEPIRAMPVYAPISGFVTGRTAYHGMKVMPADTLFDILDLSSVWVLADVYEYELPRLTLGEKATMTLSYWPGRSWNGTVTYIYPTVDEKTRTVKVRAEVDNPKGELKPEMFADVTIHGPTRSVLQVPDDTILESGARNIVFVSEAEGRLVPREVVVGDHGEGVVEIRSGLKEGEVVVRGANFLVDSESRLKAAISAMGASK